VGIPLDGESPARLQRTYNVLRRTSNGASITYGPYRASRSPISGSVALERGIALIDADERLFFEQFVNVQINDVIVCLETNQYWTAAHVQAWPSNTEVFVKRSSAAVPGNK